MEFRADTFDPRDHADRSWAGRFLSLFTEVHPGEATPAVLLLLNIFVLLGLYYLLKTVREALILSQGSAELKSYSAAGQALLLAILLPLYGWVASRVRRVVLLVGVTLFFVSNLLIFWALGVAGARVGVAFFLWIGVFNVFVIAQVWAFAADVFSPEQGKRLFPLIGVGSSLGALVGSESASQLFKNQNPYTIMLIGAALLASTCLFTIAVNRYQMNHPKQDAPPSGEPLGKEGGFKLVLSSRYLLAIAVLTILLNVVNSTGEYIFSHFVTEEAHRVVQGTGKAVEEARAQFIGGIYGSYFSWFNLAGLILQTFVVSRLFKWIGVGGTLLVLPIIALTGYSTLLFLPTLAVARWTKIAENSTDYSIENTSIQALFLPTSREVKYKAKSAIDTFFKRAGDVLQAGVVKGGTSIKLDTAHFALINVALSVVWLLVAVGIWRMHRDLVAAAPESSDAARSEAIA